MKDDKKNTGTDNDIKFDLSREAEKRTNNATSQADLPEPKLRKEDLPEADRERFKNGVYTGTGTGAGPGGSTDTGGADTTSMSDQARMGTTDRLHGNNDSRNTEGTDK